jgi:putative hydrolase of the HAD superfamily
MPAPLDSFKVLTFDVVGTIIDFEKGVIDSIRRLGGDKAAQASEDEIFEAYKRGRDRHDGRSSFAMKDVYLSLAGELGFRNDEATADAFQLAVLRWPAFSDSVQALQRLRRHYRLVAMTNTDRTVFTAYAHALGNPFDDSVTCDETGTAKPDPQFFAFNLGRQSAFGYRQPDILHVAQSQYHDIGVAKELGYTVCWIERRQGMSGWGGTPEPKSVTQPDYHYASLAQLADATDAAYKRG